MSDIIERLATAKNMLELERAAADAVDEIERLRMESTKVGFGSYNPALVLAERDAEIERLRASERSAWNAAVQRDDEIERLRKERNDILTAKEIVFQPPAIPESFVIQELQKANVALHADIARLRSGVRCPHCDELRLDLGGARREIERLRALVSESR